MPKKSKRKLPTKITIFDHVSDGVRHVALPNVFRKLIGPIPNFWLDKENP